MVDLTPARGKPLSVEIENGFRLESPDLFVPWGITEARLKELAGPSLRAVSTGYYTISCTSLGGFRHELGFHFVPRENGTLQELEFFLNNERRGPAGFWLLQKHFEAAFGPPSSVENGTAALPSYEWRFKGALIKHYVCDRFGVGHEEYGRIRRS